MTAQRLRHLCQLADLDQRPRVRLALILVLLPLAAAWLGLWVLDDALVSWNAAIFDRLFQQRARWDRTVPSYDSTLVHVDLTDTGRRRFGHPPLRCDYARAIANLGRMDVAIQAYDFIFAGSMEADSDQALADAAFEAEQTIMGMSLRWDGGEAVEISSARNRQLLILEATRWPVVVEGDASHFRTGTLHLMPFDTLATATQGLGFLTIESDRDGVYRRMPLLVRCGKAYYPSLSFRVVCDYLDVTPDRIIVRPGRHILLRGARRPGEASRDLEIPIDRRGNLIINFIGPWDRLTRYSFADVCQADEDRDELELLSELLAGRIVIVADLASGSGDLGVTPIGGDFPLSRLHSNAIHTMLTEDFIRRAGTGERLASELGLLGLVLALAVCCRPLPFAIGSLAVGLGYAVMVAVCFFEAGLLLDPVRPGLVLAMAIGTVLLHGYVREQQDRAVLHHSFRAYFPPRVVERIERQHQSVTVGGRKKELTVLFSDIENFSNHTATMAPDHIQLLLNKYFEAMTDIVFDHGGTVDKFIGDGLMVFFGDPDPQSDHAVRAVRTAIAMQRKVRELDARWKADGGIPLRIRIGINTGEMVVGNMGSARRLSYTVLGAHVNLAKRLESSTPVGGILVSRRTRELALAAAKYRPREPIEAKGFGKVPVYEVPIYEVPVG